MKLYTVCIMTNRSRTLYTGVTNNLERRVYEHKQKTAPGFTSKYNIDTLVYYEQCSDVKAAIAREKQIKGWLRAKKIALIESMNPRGRRSLARAGGLERRLVRRRDPSLRSEPALNGVKG